MSSFVKGMIIGSAIAVGSGIVGFACSHARKKIKSRKIDLQRVFLVPPNTRLINPLLSDVELLQANSTELIYMVKYYPLDMMNYYVTPLSPNIGEFGYLLTMSPKNGKFKPITAFTIWNSIQIDAWIAAINLLNKPQPIRFHIYSLPNGFEYRSIDLDPKETMPLGNITVSFANSGNAYLNEFLKKKFPDAIINRFEKEELSYFISPYSDDKYTSILTIQEKTVKSPGYSRGTYFSASVLTNMTEKDLADWLK